MTTVTLSVASRADITARARAAFAGEAQGTYISFACVDLLWETLTRKRWDLLRAMTGAGAMSIHEVARRVERDGEAVHGDMRTLIHAGIVEETHEGVLFPYDSVRVDFRLTAAKAFKGVRKLAKAKAGKRS